MEDFLRSLRTRDGTASTFLMCQVLCLGGGTDGGLPEVPEDEDAPTFLMCKVLCLGGGTDGGLPAVPEDEGRYSLNQPPHGQGQGDGVH